MMALRAVGRTVLWLLCGVAGSLAILSVVIGVAEQRNYPRLQSGHVFTDFWDRGYVTAVGTWVFRNRLTHERVAAIPEVQPPK